MRETLDQGRAFQAYCLLGGNAQKTACLCHTFVEVIESLAHDFQWGKSVHTDIGDESKLEAFKSINRLTAFMLAERIQKIVEHIIDRMARDPQFCRTMLTKVDDVPDSPLVRFDPKGLLALIKAVALVADMKYRALGDEEGSIQIKEADSVVDSMRIYEALSKRFGTKTDATLATAKVVAGEG